MWPGDFRQPTKYNSGYSHPLYLTINYLLHILTANHVIGYISVSPLHPQNYSTPPLSSIGPFPLYPSNRLMTPLVLLPLISLYP